MFWSKLHDIDTKDIRVNPEQKPKWSDDLELYKEEQLRLYADCFTCGARCLKEKMKELAVFKKEIPSYRDHVFVLPFSSFPQETTAIYFCQRCPVKYPKK